MNRDEVLAIIDALVGKFEHDFDAPIERRAGGAPPPPERDDWEALEARFGCRFEDSFVHFMELIVDYNCPTTLAVRADGPAESWEGWRIDMAYDREMELGGWNPAMIPFLALGNGDYYCLKSSTDDRSEVWFRDYGDISETKVADSFAEFLSRIGCHLNGT